jgi:pimeloyl-ACP methyl ester carboxylesterase
LIQPQTTEIVMSSPPENQIQTRRLQADGLNFFYRAAGNPDAPVLLLLHGFPSSSHQFRNLIPILATRFHVIAPDLPGFGFTEVPGERGYRYTFDDLAVSLGAFVDALGLKRYAMYVFDYGAPVGLRLALAHPERVTGLVSQNGNAYLEGLGDAWAPVRAYWAEPTGHRGCRAEPGRNEVAVRAWRRQSGRRGSGKLHARCRLA